MKVIHFAMLLMGALPSAWGQSGALVDEEILATLRVVEDPDGQSNLRAEPTLKAKVVGQVPSGSVVAVDTPNKGEWAKLSYGDLGNTPRYIHTSRLKKLNAWKQIAVSDSSNDNLGVLKHAGIDVRVMATPFVAADHKITRDKQGMHLVDGKSPWGQDGGIPKLSLSLAVTQNGDPVAIPKVATQNLFEPNMDSLVLLTPSNAGDHAVVLMMNSDGAGGYCVVWAFQKGSYRGRAVFHPF